MLLMQRKCHRRYYVNLLIYEYISYGKQGMLAINGTKISSTGFINILNQYISNISNLYNPEENLRLASQTKCDIMFSYLKSDYIFSHFCFSVTHLVYIFFIIVCGNYPLTSKRGRCRTLL